MQGIPRIGLPRRVTAVNGDSLRREYLHMEGRIRFYGTVFGARICNCELSWKRFNVAHVSTVFERSFWCNFSHVAD